jgi:hypothetical protein
MSEILILTAPDTFRYAPCKVKRQVAAGDYTGNCFVLQRDSFKPPLLKPSLLYLKAKNETVENCYLHR